MLSVEDCVNIEIKSLRKYVRESQIELKTAVKNEDMIAAGKEKAEVQRHRQETCKRKER